MNTTKNSANDCANTMNFLSQIFGEQIELGLDYLTLLYFNPNQKLPALVLYSSERSTGKTTFLRFVKTLFDDKMTEISSSDLQSNFNSHWATKIVIGIDDALIEKQQNVEQLKRVMTTDKIQLTTKGKKANEIEFSGKFILCTNSIESFENFGTRFWLRNTPTVQTGIENFTDLLKEEIPAFLHFLQNRKLSTENKTRVWFTPEQIKEN